MVKSKTESQAGGKDSGATEDAESKPEKKKQRTALSGGIPYNVERSFYDPRQNCVVDVLRVNKVVKNRKGEDVDIVTFRHQYCKDEAIQEKYRQNRTIDLEVTDV